jgi:hypothetical protein
MRENRPHVSSRETYCQEAIDMTTAAADTIHVEKTDEGHGHRYGGCAGKKKWSKVELATMIGGFIVFWPVGLIALGAKLVNGEMWPGARDNVMPWTAWQTHRDAKGGPSYAWKTSAWSKPASGNAAFDDYRKAQLDRLEAERRKLDDEQKAFAEYVDKLRRAKDQDEFDRFMAERNSGNAT